MGGPNYKNFSREYITEHIEIIEVANYDFYESDRYEECPVYKCILKKVNGSWLCVRGIGGMIDE